MRSAVIAGNGSLVGVDVDCTMLAVPASRAAAMELMPFPPTSRMTFGLGLSDRIEVSHQAYGAIPSRLTDTSVRQARAPRTGQLTERSCPPRPGRNEVSARHVVYLKLFAAQRSESALQPTILLGLITLTRCSRVSVRLQPLNKRGLSLLTR